jgi:hypothetical protein
MNSNRLHSLISSDTEMCIKLIIKLPKLTPETNSIFQTDNAGKLKIEDHVAGR